MYSVSEVAEYQAVCAEVLSGSVAGREIEISYTTTGGKNTNLKGLMSDTIIYMSLASCLIV